MSNEKNICVEVNDLTFHAISLTGNKIKLDDFIIKGVEKFVLEQQIGDLARLSLTIYTDSYESKSTDYINTHHRNPDELYVKIPLSRIRFDDDFENYKMDKANSELQAFYIKVIELYFQKSNEIIILPPEKVQSTYDEWMK